MTDDEDMQLPPVIMEKLGLLYDFLKTPKGISFLLVFIAIMFNAVFLFSEMSINTFPVNDEVIHLTATQDASLAIRQNVDPTDFWLTQIDLGYPLFHSYQHFPQVLLAIIDQITSSIISLPHLFDIFKYLLLVLFPFSIFLSMRRFEFDYIPAGIAAFVASLLSTNGLFGIEYGTYIWLGYGLYTQLWAMFFFPIALAEIYRVMKRDGSLLLAVILSSIVLLSNLIYGYMLIVSAILFVFLIPNKLEIISRIKELSRVFIFTAIATAYFFIPCILDLKYYNRSIWFDPLRYGSLGAVEILKSLFTGNLFDYGRLPILTILFLVAIIVVAIRYKQEKYRLLFVLTIFWLFAYFGEPTWGIFLDSLPFIHNLHFHRFIGGFQIGAVMVIGAGIPLVWKIGKKYLSKIPSFKLPIVIGIIFLLLITPIYLERIQLYQYNSQWKTENYNTFLFKNQEVSSIKETLQKSPPGRVYAGIPADFGKDSNYKIGYVPLYSILTQMGFDTFGYAYTAFPLVTDIRLLFNNKKIEQYNVFNVRYVLLHKTWSPADYYSKIKSFENFILYEVPTTGYFDLVDVPAVFYGEQDNFYYPNSKWLVSPLMVQKQYPIIEIGGKPLNTSGLPVYSFTEVDVKILSNLSRIQPISGKILNENVSINKYQANFTTSRECYLMLKTSYYPGWVVTIDGKKVPTVMLTPGFIGIKVSQGTHNATFTYEPPFYRLPLFIIGVISLIILGLHQIKFFEGRFYQNIVAYLIHIYKYE
jgi:hypothetical protein